MRINNFSISNGRRIVANILIFLGGLVLLASASGKFAHAPQVVAEFQAWGFEGKLTLIAAGETLCALLFLIPFTRSIGMLLVSSYMGGAIATHMQHGQTAHTLGAAAFLSILWLGAWLRHPEMLWSLSYSAHNVSYLPHQEHRESALREI